MTGTVWTPRPGNLTEQHGLSLVENRNGFAVLSVHYTADPDKDTLEWFEKTRKGYSEAKWRQEYEINYELSGSLVFDRGVLEWYSTQCVVPEVGKLKLEINEDKAIYRAKFTKGFGDLRVWKHPEKDKRYVIGVDVSEGLGEGMGDWSVATVIEYESMECVAVWRGQYSPDLLAVESHNLGLYYNNALIGVEANGLGLATILTLRNGFPKYDARPYYRLYFRVILDDKTQKKTRKYGWLTTSQSKPVMIADLEAAIREKALVVKDMGFIREARSYIVTEKGGTEALRGKHDDQVMSMAVAVQLRKWLPPRIDYTNIDSKGTVGADETSGY